MSDTKELKLRNGMVAMVDAEDYDFLNQFEWNAVKSKSGGYHAMTTLVMHRVVTKAPKGKIVDHIDRDGLNNRKANLRFTTVAGNAANRDKPKTSAYIGVVKIQNKKSVSFRAYTTVQGKYKCIGHFTDEKLAAIKRDEFVHDLYGMEAELNFPELFQEDKIDNCKAQSS